MLRYAKPSDFDFIYSLTMHDAQDGHFNREYCQNPDATKGLILEITSILGKRIRPNGLEAYGLIYEHDSKSAGFVIMSAGPENKGNELLMASIRPDIRGKKHGKRMLTNILNQFKGKKVMLLARCAPESEIMYQFLLKNGFKHIETGKTGVRGLLYAL